MFFNDQTLQSHAEQHVRTLRKQARNHKILKPSRQFAQILRQIANQIDPSVDQHADPIFKDQGGSYVHT